MFLPFLVKIIEASIVCIPLISVYYKMQKFGNPHTQYTLEISVNGFKI